MKKKTTIVDILGKKRLYFDGGTGTCLQKMGLEPGSAPEAWSLTNPEKIEALHAAYLESGADIIKTNTFGVSSLKYENFEEYIFSAVECARRATERFEDKFIAFDIGPLGKMLKPFGDMEFDKAVAVFADSVRAAVKAGVDLILIETMNDAFETKAAVLAAKENSDLPIFVTNVYDESGKLLTGASPEAMAVMLEGLGVSAIGANCSLGPDKMIDVARRLCSVCSVPVIVNPNAGLPVVRDGVAEFDIDSDEFADYMTEMAEIGVSVMGGCCGTTPEYISEMIRKTENIVYQPPKKKAVAAVSSYAKFLPLGERPIIVGERINPTGKPNLRRALRENDISYILSEAVSQEDAGADALDVNVGLPEIDEASAMRRAVSEIQAVCALPLQIDSGKAEVLESAMRIYGGKPLVNSVNGSEESMSLVFPLVKKYGGAVICLTMDEGGIPESAEERVKIAIRIERRAAEYGIGRENLIFDPLAMTVTSNKNAARVTLNTVKALSELGYMTALGVSNASFGLPARDKINAAYFTMALDKGLRAAIINPKSAPMMDAYHAFLAVSGLDENFEKYIAYADRESVTAEPKKADEGMSLEQAIVSGLKEKAALVARELALCGDPIEIINSQIIPALTRVGDGFEKGKVYLPGLLMSAEAASAAFEILKEKMPKKEQNARKAILATVKGDIHDIGKNIVKTVLESYGYSVIDLGKDVSAEEVLDAVKRSGVRLVGLSALMTTTVPAMEETVKLIHNECEGAFVMVGGAVLNAEYAKMIGADAYASDAMGAVRAANEFYQNSEK